MLHDMPDFVAQEFATLRDGAAFDFEHLLSLEALESRMGQIERNPDPDDAFGRKPVVRKPEIGSQTQSASGEFAADGFDRPFEPAACEGDVEVAESRGQDFGSAEAVERAAPRNFLHDFRLRSIEEGSNPAHDSRSAFARVPGSLPKDVADRDRLGDHAAGDFPEEVRCRN